MLEKFFQIFKILSVKRPFDFELVSLRLIFNNIELVIWYIYMIMVYIYDYGIRVYTNWICPIFVTVHRTLYS